MEAAIAFYSSAVDKNPYCEDQRDQVLRKITHMHKGEIRLEPGKTPKKQSEKQKSRQEKINGNLFTKVNSLSCEG